MGTLSEMTSATSFELMDLPDEVLLIVMRHLDFDSLLDAIYVSKHFHALVEQFIYESITVLHGEKALNLSHSLAKDRRRAGWIRALLISTKFGQETALMKLPRSIRQMHNLQELRLETPDCNSKKPEDRLLWIQLQDSYEQIFYQSSVVVQDRATRLLPNLKSCVLHFVDTHTELYSLTRYSSIFLHPTLQSLTISCMSTDFPDNLFRDIPDINAFQRSTALEYLHLEECDIHPPSLELLLYFPRALKSLKISEGVRYDNFRTGSSRMHGNLKPMPLAQALVNTCKDSLENLSLALGHTRSTHHDISHVGQHLKLRDLENLKSLEVNNRTLNLIRSRPNCDHNLWKRLPISLDTLKVFAVPLLPPQHDTRTPYIPLSSCVIREKQLHGLPNLRKIIYSYEHYESTDDDEMNFNDLLMNLVYNEVNGNPLAEQDDAAPNANEHPNPLFNLLQQAVTAANAPQPQPLPVPAPPAPNLIAAPLNPNLDGPVQHVQPPRFRWRTGPPLSASETRPELSRSDAAKLTLLTGIHETVLEHFIHTKTHLQIDIVALPRSFIPPYLFPEDKPKSHEAWWTSDNPITPSQFVDNIRRQREESRLRMNRSTRRDEIMETYESERERSRSRFIERLNRGDFDDRMVSESESDSDSETDEEENTELADEFVIPMPPGGFGHAILDDDEAEDESADEGEEEMDEMEVEDLLEMLVQEAAADSDGDSVYVDAGSEVDISETELDAGRTHEDGRR